MLVDAYKCSCGNRGTEFYYDTNPRHLPAHDPDFQSCSFGAIMTGEPGAVRCMECDGLEGLDVHNDGEVEVDSDHELPH
jgi:hypothetical protein